MQIKKFLNFLYLVFKDYPRLFILMVIFILISSIFELLSFAALLPIVEEFVNTGNPDSYEYQYISTISVYLGVTVNFEVLLLALVFIFLLKAVFVFLANYQQQKIGVYTSMDLRSSIYKNLFQAGWPFFIHKRVGDLSNITITQTKQAAIGIKHLARFIVSIVFVTVLFIVSLAISWQVVLLSGVIALLIYSLINFIFKSAHALGEEIGLRENKINQVAINSFTAPKHIKGAALENHFIEWFNKVLDDAKIIEICYARITSFLTSLTEPISVITGIIILFVSLIYFELPLGKVVILVLVFYRLYQRIGTLPNSYANVLYYLPLYQMCKSLKSEAGKARELVGDIKIAKFEKCVELKNVSFGYESANPVLKGINLVIHKGEFIGITGRSGGGKTTLVDLILGLFQPTKGDILVDDSPLAKYNLFSWRQKIGYVAQDNVLYNLSIIENITLGASRVDQEKVRQVTMLAHADEFIQQLPDGYNTIIGERGLTLSGGQRQRIVLAQALYHEPEILILDEATSNLDNKSEALIQQSINNLLGKITIIAITHRLKTLESAGRIIVIENGQIIEQGSHAELIQSSGFLKQLMLAGGLDQY